MGQSLNIFSMKIFWIIFGGVVLALSPLAAQTPADTVRLTLPPKSVTALHLA